MESTWLETALPTLLSKFSLADIYNADEFGFMYATLPSVTLHFNNETCKGGKLSKSRLTGLVAASATGNKLPLLIIGKSQKPRCFKNVRCFPCSYKAKAKAWMNSSSFTEWLYDLDKKFLEEKRKILMLVDNCPAHPDVPNLKAITLRFLPKNTTSKLQPMDQGVIRSMKAYYRKDLVRRAITSIEKYGAAPKINVLDAMSMLSVAWESMLTKTIVNCFKHAHISEGTQAAAEDDADDPFKALTEGIEELKLLSPTTAPDNATAENFVSFDNEVSTSSSDEPTDEDILREVQNDELKIQDDESEIEIIPGDLRDDTSEPKRPTTTEVLSSVHMLTSLSNFVSNENSEVLKRYAKGIQNIIDKDASFAKPKQSSLDDFFPTCV